MTADFNSSLRFNIITASDDKGKERFLAKLNPGHIYAPTNSITDSSDKLMNDKSLSSCFPI